MPSEIERLRAEIRSTLSPSSAGWRAKVLRLAAWLTAPSAPQVEYRRIEDVLPPEQLAEHRARHERELTEVIAKLIGEGRFDEVLRVRFGVVRILLPVS
jgi:hypothetical protein